MSEHNKTWNDSIEFLPTKYWSYQWIAITAVYLILITIASVIGNFTAIVVLTDLKKHKKSLMNNQVLLSLASADLLVGLFVIPSTVDVVLHGKWRAGVYKYFNAAGNFCFCISSIVHLALLSVDRYISITLPLRYQIIMSVKKTSILCLASWIYSSLWALVPAISKTVAFECFIPYIGTCNSKYWTNDPASSAYTFSVIFFTFGISAIVMCICHIRIFHIIQNQKKKVYKTTRLGRLSTNGVEPNNGQNLPNQNSSTRKQELRTRKGSLIIAIIILLYLVAWTPFCGVLFVELVKGRKITDSWGIVTMFIGLGNSACNPIIYCLKYNKFRRSLLTLICRRRQLTWSSSQDIQGRRSNGESSL